MNRLVAFCPKSLIVFASLVLLGSKGLAQSPQENSEAPPQILQIPAQAATPPPNAGAKGPDQGESTPDAELVEAIPGDPWGDAQGLNLISMRSLFQTRYTSTWAEDSDASRASYIEREEILAQEGDGWSLERVLLRLSSDPVKYVGFKAVLDFSELISGDVEDVVKQAYSTVSPMPGRLSFVVGLFKLPFSVLELDPSARYEFAELGPSNQLLGDLGFAGRDYGLQVIGSPLRKAKRLTISLGAFRGHAYDEHDSPAGAIAGRIEVKPSKSLRFGVDAVGHLLDTTYNRPFNTSDKDVLPDPPDPLYPAQKRWGQGGAYGVDARFKKKGFMLRGEFVYGDRVDIDRRYDARHFWSAWGIAAYGFDVGPVKLLPALRAEWLDSDADHGKGAFMTLSGSFTVIAWSRVRFLVDATYTGVEPNTPVLNQPKPLQADPYLALSNTRLTAQLQLEL